MEPYAISVVYYDRDGMEIDRDTLARYWADQSYRYIAKTQLPNGYLISTVWTGIDYGEGKTLETMVFPCDKHGNPVDWVEVDCRRYRNEIEAILGHDEMLLKWSQR